MNLVMSSIQMAEKPDGFPLRKILKAVAIGLGGNIILIAFLMTFMPVLGIIKFMPWIIAFNTAHAGYSLVDRSGNLAFPKLISALAGSTNAVITTGLFALLSSFLSGDLYLGIGDAGLFIITGVLCSVAGTILAVKYYKTNVI
jgi:hypothetical protein